MKTKIITGLLIYCAIFSKAQSSQNISSKPIGQEQRAVAQHLNSIKTAPYIFEGTVVQQSNQGIWRCNVIQITKIYRGAPQIKIGTIKVITEGKGIEDAPPGLNRGATYIVFARIDSNTFQSIATDNLLTFWCSDRVDFHNDGATWGWRHPTSYNTVDSLYSFLKENGLTVQQEIQQKK